MKKFFDLYAELENRGFREQKNAFGLTELAKSYEKEVEVAWYGKCKSEYKVSVVFSQDKGTLTAYYYKGFGSPVKVKSHLNDKRALNAIIATVENAGFAI